MPKAKTWEEYKAECEAVAKPGITILGWVGEWKGNSTKLLCSCELHGKWTTTNIGNFRTGSSCPACARLRVTEKQTPEWEDELKLCEQVKKDGISILGFIPPYTGTKTKLRLCCEEHGEWSTTAIIQFKKGISCPKCGRKTTGEVNSKSDEEHISEFFSTGAFKDGCKFWRSPKLTSSGRAQYWYSTCPICSEDEFVKAGLCTGVFESCMGHLKRGAVPCRCSDAHRFTKAQWEYLLAKECENRGYVFVGWRGKRWGSRFKFSYECPLHGEQSTTSKNLLKGQGCSLCAGHNQQQCYINLVKDGSLPVALKVGISCKSDARLRQQNLRNLFQMAQIAVYEFPTVESCKAAEKACLSEIRCGVLSARELQDGYTETVALTDYDKVVSIYERFGGVRVDTLTEEDV